MVTFSEKDCYSDRYIKALSLVAEFHQKQTRKQGTPYIAHLLSVSSLIWEAGGTEDEAIAGLAHDLMEDLNIPYNDMKYYFGQNVADIVSYLTEDETLPLELRKEAYVGAIANSNKSVALVSAAGKLHNLQGYCQNPELVTPDLVNFYHQLYPVYWNWLEPMTGRKNKYLPDNLILSEMRELLVNKLFPMYTIYVYEKEGEDSYLCWGRITPSKNLSVATSTQVIDSFNVRDKTYPEFIRLADGDFTKERLITFQEEKYPEIKKQNRLMGF